MLQYKKEIDDLLWIKSEPNEHERYLFERAQKYITKLTRIPGIKMIAICNSLSMYATHKDSDIDLFIITKPEMIWFVRFFTTITLWINGVWRKNQDIRENFCLSFFTTTDAMDLSKIAIENDIYLYYWIYYMKPIIVKNDMYEKFLKANNWVEISEDQRKENQNYIIHSATFFVCEFCVSIREYFRKKFQTVWAKASFWNLENRAENRYQNEAEKIKTFGTFSHKSTDNIAWRNEFYIAINQIIRFFLLPKTIKSKAKLWNPEWVIISDDMLKFHDKDRRKEISEAIFKKNFEK